MIYKYATLGMLALAGTAMSVPAFAESSSQILLNNPERAVADSKCVFENFSEADQVSTARTAAAKALKGDQEPDPNMVELIGRNIKKCAGKTRWNTERQDDAAAFTTVILTHTGMAIDLSERGIDSEKLDTWFDAQDAAFKTTDVEALTEKDGEKFGLRIFEGAIKAGYSVDIITENLEPIAGYVATSIIIENMVSVTPS